MKKLVLLILQYCARKRLQKWKPIIIGITGSVGKSSTKECIAHVIEPYFHILKTEKNLNTEFGLPLTILELPPATSKWGWIKTVQEAWKRSKISEKSYEVLVLEMGAQYPGDLKVLTDLTPPNISVVTAVEPAHIEFFKTIDAIAYEKATLIRNLQRNGLGVVNYDNQYTRNMIHSAPNNCWVKTFGFDAKADIVATRVENSLVGLKGIIEDEGQHHGVHLPHIIGKHSMYMVLAAWAVARKLGIPANEIAQRLKTFRNLSGRLTLIEGINQSYVIDSSYNASPASMKAALDTLKDLPTQGRKIAIIGDMLELGELEQESHTEIGLYALQHRFDLVIFCGPRMKIAYNAFLSGPGEFKNIAMHYESSKEASQSITQKIKKNDLVLVKGSLGSKMKIVLEVIQKSIHS